MRRAEKSFLLYSYYKLIKFTKKIEITSVFILLTEYYEGFVFRKSSTSSFFGREKKLINFIIGNLKIKVNLFDRVCFKIEIKI